MAADWMRILGARLVFGAAISVGLAGCGAEQPQRESSGSTSSPSPSPTLATSPSATAVPVGWTPVEIPGMTVVSDLVERDGRLVAIGSVALGATAAVIAYSDDGVDWTQADTSSLQLDGASFFSLSAGDAGFVAYGGRTAADLSFEDLYYFSADGSEWQLADPPEECAAGLRARQVGSVFIKFGDICVSDGAPPPGPARVVTSADGRSWTSRIDPTLRLGSWATNGHRIVMLTACCGTDATVIAISDDGAATWHQITDAFPIDVTVYNVTFGHDRYVAEASWLRRVGDPDWAVCMSLTGEVWTCQALSSGTSPPEDRRQVGSVTATSTGFASLAVVPNDQVEQLGTTVILGTSTNGLTWTFEPAPAMKDSPSAGLAGTSHGVFAWGSAEEVKPDGTVLPAKPYILLYQAPLP
jgi:hypothetical protein